MHRFEKRPSAQHAPVDPVLHVAQAVGNIICHLDDISQRKPASFRNAQPLTGSLNAIALRFKEAGLFCLLAILGVRRC